jgi:hypothetical protein
MCADRFDTVYVLFDAFDEVDKAQQDDILALIRRFIVHPSLRVMLTGRSYLPRLSKLLKPALLMTVNAEDGDIRTYLSSRLEREPYLSQESKNHILEVISDGAEGMYDPQISMAKS